MSSIPVIDYQEFRRRLARLNDPDKPIGGSAVTQDIKDYVSRLCSILASLFGEELDRMTLWSRIASGLAVGVAKVTDGNLDRFISLCLEHVSADTARAAACEPLLQTLEVANSRPDEWRQAVLHYISTHSYSVIVHGRSRWEQVKSKGVDL